MILKPSPHFNPFAGRCKQCKSVLMDNEKGHKWCNKCRSREKDKNDRKKENRESRDGIAALFGYNRKAAREKEKDSFSLLPGYKR